MIKAKNMGQLIDELKKKGYNPEPLTDALITWKNGEPRTVISSLFQGYVYGYMASLVMTEAIDIWTYANVLAEIEGGKKCTH